MSSVKLPQTDPDPSAEEDPIPLTRPRAPVDGSGSAEGTLCPGLKLVAVAGAALLPRALSKRLARFEVEVIATTPTKSSEVNQDIDDATVVVVDRHLEPSTPGLAAFRERQHGRTPVVTCDLADAVASQEGLRALLRAIEPAVVSERRLREALQVNRAVRVPIGVLRPSQLLRIALDTSPWTLRASANSIPLRIDTAGRQLVARSEDPSGLSDGHSDRLLEAFLALTEGEALFQRRTSEVVPAGTASRDTSRPSAPVSGVRRGVAEVGMPHPGPSSPRRRPSKPTLVGFVGSTDPTAPETDPDRLHIPGVVEYRPSDEAGERAAERRAAEDRPRPKPVANHKPTERLWQPGSDSDPISGAYLRPSSPRPEEPSGAIRIDRTGRRSTPAYGPQSELVRRRESDPARPSRTQPPQPTQTPRSQRALGSEDRWWEGSDTLGSDEPLSPLKLSVAYRLVRGLFVTSVLTLLAGLGYAAYMFFR